MNHSFTFNLKDRKSKKPTLIYLRASIKNEGKYLKYSTGESIVPKYWDFETQFPKRIKGRSAEAVNINSMIKQLSRYAESFQLVCSKIGAQDLDLKVKLIRSELDYIFKKSSVSPNSFFAVYDTFIKEKKDLGKVTKGTLNRYDNIKTLLENFSKEKSYKISFTSINEDFYVKFVNYSRKILEHKNNTLGRNIGFIKTFMNWAADKRHHTNYDFKKFKKTSSDTDEIALSSKELQNLYEYDFTRNKRLEKVRDVFVFGCATGLRYSDYSRISKGNIRDGQIFINTQKQKSNLGVPLNKYSKEILNKYNYELPVISPQKFREYIKEACGKVGFKDKIIKTTYIGNKRIEDELFKYQMVSTHTARRTFITISLEKGMRPEIVMSITGHKSYSSFKKYIKLSNKIREEEMLKAWN